MMNAEEDRCQTLIIEPFYGGSHQQLVDLLVVKAPYCMKYTLPAKKWHWVARTSALHFAQVVPRSEHYKVLFASSVLNLAELTALRRDLASLYKVLYFHENQLVYPVRKQSDRDFQYGYNQIMSCLVADTVLFNSNYNMESFLSAIDSFLGMIPIPDYRSKGMHRAISHKCKVLHFPLVLPELDNMPLGSAGGCRPFSPPLRSSKSEPAGPRTGDLKEVKLRRSFPQEQSEDGSSLKGLASLEEPEEKEVPKEAKAGKDHMVRRNARRDSDTSSKYEVSTRSVDSPKSKTGTRWHRDQARRSEESEEISPLQAQYTIESLDLSVLTAKDRRALWKSSSRDQEPMHILWAHRWEHDKNPDLFFHAIFKLHETGLSFNLSVLGEQFAEVPDIFAEAKSKLQDHIVNWGYLPKKEDYHRVLFMADVAVSTADHEFFGVAMMEAVYMRCYPLCPNGLVYPEIFPKDYLYSTSQQLFKRLREFCRHPQLVRKHSIQVDAKQYSWERLKHQYLSVLTPPVASQQDNSLIRRSTTQEDEADTLEKMPSPSTIKLDEENEQAGSQQDRTATQSKPPAQPVTQQDKAVALSVTLPGKSLAQPTVGQGRAHTQSSPRPDGPITQSFAQQAKLAAQSITNRENPVPHLPRRHNRAGSPKTQRKTQNRSSECSSGSFTSPVTSKGSNS